MDSETLDPPADALALICLCAEWCGTCRDYRPVWTAHAASAPRLVHLWVDIEDDADSLGDLDIETFPTLLVLRGDQPQFFGPVLPQPEAIDRIVQSTTRMGSAAVQIAPSDRVAIEWLVQQARRARAESG